MKSICIFLKSRSRNASVQSATRWLQLNFSIEPAEDPENTWYWFTLIMAAAQKLGDWSDESNHFKWIYDWTFSRFHHHLWSLYLQCQIWSNLIKRTRVTMKCSIFPVYNWWNNVAVVIVAVYAEERMAETRLYRHPGERSRPGRFKEDS